MKYTSQTMARSHGSIEPTNLTAAAGDAGGSWYVLLEGLAALVHEVRPEIVIKVVEGGGVENHARVVPWDQAPTAWLEPATKLVLVR